MFVRAQEQAPHAPAPHRGPDAPVARSGRSAAGVLALQRAAGNAATVRALGHRALQRAPLWKVMPAEHNFFYGQNKMCGYARKIGMPPGYHVTIYPALSSDQMIGAISGHKLGELGGYQSIEFNGFNVTRDENRKHYYFDDTGNVVWAQTKTEASLEDPHWDDAVAAALVIYGNLGVTVTAQALYDQLHRMGRTQRVSTADTYGMPKPTPLPMSTGSSLKFVPPQLRRPTQQPVKPTAKPVPQAPRRGVTIPFDYSTLPPPDMGPSAMDFLPVFEHEEDLEMDTNW